MKLRKLRYLIIEGIKSVWANRLMSLASVGVLVACMLLIGIAVAIGINVDKTMGEIQKQNVVMAYFKDYSWAVNEGVIDPDAATEPAEGETQAPAVNNDSLYFIHDDEEGEALCEQIKQLDNVADAVYVSSEEGLGKMLETMPEAQREYFEEWLSDDNPLSGAAMITMEDLSKFDQTIAKIESIEAIHTTYHQRDLAEKITAIENALAVAGVWIIGILLLISMVIVSNTIRVTMYNRKLEISIMKAVGATDAFVRIPFVVEGVLIGLISALISEGLLYFCYRVATETIVTTLGTSDIVKYEDMALLLLAVFVGIGVFAGILGSFIMIRKYLKHEGSEFAAI
jgi:cell division transport system permease protein